MKWRNEEKGNSKTDEMRVWRPDLGVLTGVERGQVRRTSKIRLMTRQRGDNSPPSSFTPNVASNSTPNLSRTALSDSTTLEIWGLAV